MVKYTYILPQLVRKTCYQFAKPSFLNAYNALGFPENFHFIAKHKMIENNRNSIVIQKNIIYDI